MRPPYCFVLLLAHISLVNRVISAEIAIEQGTSRPQQGDSEGLPQGAGGGDVQQHGDGEGRVAARIPAKEGVEYWGG